MAQTTLALLLLGLAATGFTQDYIYEDFICPKDFGYFAHETQCDAFWHCEEGQPQLKLCGSGLAFDDTDDTREHCNYIFTIECGNRTEFEPAISTPNCPYLYGIFPDPADCNVFWSCWNGEASRYECGPGLAYDPTSRICTWKDAVPSCKDQQTLNGLICPASGALVAKGSFTRHAHPEDCRQYYVCFDGTPREYGCPIGTVFAIGDQEGLGLCSDPITVPGCEDYYGELDLAALRNSQLLLGGLGTAKGSNRKTIASNTQSIQPQASNPRTTSRRQQQRQQQLSTDPAVVDDTITVA